MIIKALSIMPPLIDCQVLFWDGYFTGKRKETLLDDLFWDDYCTGKRKETLLLKSLGEVFNPMDFPLRKRF